MESKQVIRYRGIRLSETETFVLIWVNKKRLYESGVVDADYYGGEWEYATFKDTDGRPLFKVQAEIPKDSFPKDESDKS